MSSNTFRFTGTSVQQALERTWRAHRRSASDRLLLISMRSSKTSGSRGRRRLFRSLSRFIPCSTLRGVKKKCV